MIKRKYHITPEQQKYRSEILKVKEKIIIPRKPRKRKWDYEPSPPPTRENYIHNCIYWIKEYEAGRIDAQRCLSACINLKIYMQQIIEENHPSKNNK